MSIRVKKAGGKVYGADLTAAQKLAMNMEIQRQLAVYDRGHMLEVQAVFLWQLHTQLGFGPKRLKKFYDGFAPALRELTKRYELEDTDQIWLCTHMLKQIGVDIDQWDKNQTNQF